MKIIGRAVMVDIENNITLENGSISMTILHQAYINENHVDIELADYTNVLFLGKKITYSKLRDTLKNIDIELDLLVNEKCVELFTDDEMNYLQSLYNE